MKEKFLSKILAEILDEDLYNAPDELTISLILQFQMIRLLRKLAEELKCLK